MINSSGTKINVSTSPKAVCVRERDSVCQVMMPFIECSPVLDAQLIYGGLAVTLPLAVMSFADGARRYFLRPRWIPVKVLDILLKNRLLVIMLAEISLILAAIYPEFIIARIIASLFFASYALHHNSVVGTHFEMCALWSTFALLLPSGSTRVLILRLISCYSVAAPGLIKLFVAGIEWGAAANMRMMNYEFAPGDLVKNVVKATPDVALGFAGRLSLLFEAIFPFAIIFCRNSDDSTIVFTALFLFHTGCLLLVGMFFLHHIPVYAGALFTESPSFTSIGIFPIILIIIFVTVVVTAYEDWPISNMGLFPYSASQAFEFKKKFGGNLRLVGTTISTKRLIGLTLRDASAIDLITFCLRATVPLIPEHFEGDGRHGCPTYWADSWIPINSMDLANKSTEAVNIARKVFGIPAIIYDTRTLEPLRHFHVVELDAKEKIRKIIVTSSVDDTPEAQPLAKDVGASRK